MGCLANVWRQATDSSKGHQGHHIPQRQQYADNAQPHPKEKQTSHSQVATEKNPQGLNRRWAYGLDIELQSRRVGELRGHEQRPRRIPGYRRRVSDVARLGALCERRDLCSEQRLRRWYYRLCRPWCVANRWTWTPARRYIWQEAKRQQEAHDATQTNERDNNLMAPGSSTGARRTSSHFRPIGQVCSHNDNLSHTASRCSRLSSLGCFVLACCPLRDKPKRQCTPFV